MASTSDLALRRRTHPPPATPVVLVIMDGIGLGTGDAGDAVAAAATPNFDALAGSPLALRLRAHGKAVGMPLDSDMGNSEVGHNAMGAGRIIEQGAARVGQAIADKSIFAGAAWRRAMIAGCAHSLHLIGLLSDGNVHSHIDHLLALVEQAMVGGVKRLRVHVLLDGRDVPRTSADGFVRKLEAALARWHQVDGRDVRIASGGGRMALTMDRYNADWPMVERGWQVHVAGRGRGYPCAADAIAHARRQQPGIGDQDLPGFVIDPQAPADGRDNARGIGAMQDGDALIAFNFRGDRMLELCHAVESDSFTHFARTPRPQLIFAGMTQYDGDLQAPKHYLVPPPTIDHTLSELLCAAGVRQLAISETQKFGHVTYFWSGNRSGGFDTRLERAIEVPSHRPPFDQRPKMAAVQVVDRCLAQLRESPVDFVRINLANGDMVGHTGCFEATVEAVACVDACIGRLREHVLQCGGILVVTGDHGNADDMIERDATSGQLKFDGSGQPVAKTSHSLNLVPLWLDAPPAVLARLRTTDVPSPGLANLASSLAVLLGFEAPTHMLAPLWHYEGSAGQR